MKYLVILLALVPMLALSDKGEGASETAPVSDYRSDAFGFRFRSNPATWYGWPGIAETYPHSVLGALSDRGYGVVVMPFCWAGPRPAENAVISVLKNDLFDRRSGFQPRSGRDQARKISILSRLEAAPTTFSTGC